MDKLLSIIVPAYNMEQYIERCLNSILSADDVRTLIQIIVVNDGSKDNTSKIAHNIESKYPEIITIIDKENGNYGSAVNVGLKHVQGKYFRIVDSDDTVDPEALSTIINKLSTSSEVDMVIAGYRQVDETGKILNQTLAKDINFDKIYEATTFNINQPNLQGCFWMHGVIYNKNIISKCNLHLQEGISYTDTEYCYYPWNVVSSIMFIDAILYNYLVGRTGQTVSDESYKKNKNNLYQIIDRAITEDGINLRNNNTITSNKINVLKNALYVYYRTILVLSKECEDDKQKLTLLDEKIKGIPLLQEASDNICIYRLFYVVKRWRKKHKYSNGLIVKIASKIQKILK